MQEDLDAAVQVAPEDIQVRRIRGLVFLSEGKPSEALAEFNAALSAQPGAEFLHRDRARAYLAAGDQRRAAADIETAERLARRE